MPNFTGDWFIISISMNISNDICLSLPHQTVAAPSSRLSSRLRSSITPIKSPDDKRLSKLEIKRNTHKCFGQKREIISSQIISNSLSFHLFPSGQL